MIRLFILIVNLLTVILFIGCGASNPVIATIGDEKITLHEFEDSYAKNNGGWDTSDTSSLEERQRFLDLIVKFRLKIKEARAQGLEKDSAIISEMEAYQIPVAKTYMLEKELIDPGIQQLYNRRKEMVRAGHILLRLTPNASPADTLKLYELAMNVISQIPNNPFDSLAIRYSEDPSAKSNYGDLGFFGGGRMVPEFEDACYSMKPGEYTKTPVRTRYGYHIIKVAERKPNPGSIRVSRILLRFDESLKDTATVKDTIWALYNQIRGGEMGFKDAIVKYSHDARNDGDLGFYECDRIPSPVAEVLYRTQIDSITEPMRFNYGYNIFKITDKKELQQLEEITKDLKSQYQQVRYQYEYDRFTQNLKSRYKVIVDSTAVNSMVSSVDTTKVTSSENWSDTLSAEMLKAPLIYCAGRPFTVRNFVNKVTTSNEYRGQFLTPVNIWNLIAKLVEVAPVEEHARHSMERYPKLAQLLREYEDGILLYRIEQDEVWKKVVVNDSLLKEYYEIHKEEYKWPRRVNFAEIHTSVDSLAKVAYRKVQKGEDFMDVAQEFTKRPGYREKKGEWGFQPVIFNDLSFKASTMSIDSVSEPFQYESGWSIIKTLGKENARLKSFEEVASEIAGVYQDIMTKQREQEWMEALNRKYPVAVNKEILTEAFKRKRVEPQ